MTVLHRRDITTSVRRSGTCRRTGAIWRRCRACCTRDASTRCSTSPTTGRRARPASQVEAAARSCGDGCIAMCSSRASPRMVQASITARAHPLVPDDYPNPYAQHKASSERALFRMHADIRLSRSPRSGRRSSTDRGSRSIVSSSSGIGCAMAVRSSCPTAATRRCSGCSCRIWPKHACGQSRCRRRRAKRSTSRMWSRLTQRSFVEALARVAGVAATFAAMPRAMIHGGRRAPVRGQPLLRRVPRHPPAHLGDRQSAARAGRHAHQPRGRARRGLRLVPRRSHGARSTTRSRIGCWLSAHDAVRFSGR